MKTKFEKGFCPSLRTPIEASDGLLLRIRPNMDYLSNQKLISLCNLSMNFGSGIMELTNRGSIQIRGIKKYNHEVFLNQIFKKGIINEQISAYNSNVIINPFWENNDHNCMIYDKIIRLQKKLPSLPNKFGFVVDLGQRLMLKNISADIRIERAQEEQFLIRADGSTKGKIVKLKDINKFILEMIDWFLVNKNKDMKRMSELTSKRKLPSDWTKDESIDSFFNCLPQNSKIGQILGIKLGRFKAKDLKKLIVKCKSPRIRFTPFKMIVLEGVSNIKDRKFIYNKKEPILNLSACSGKKFCSSASIDTFKIAKLIKNQSNKKIHIAGCKKKCGTNKDTEIIFTGNEGFIDVFDNIKKKTIQRKLTSLDIPKKNFRDI